MLCNIAGVTQVISRGEALPDFDLHCPLLSLPLACRTELATIPANIPYLQYPREERVAQWRGKLPQNCRLRVGICWAGGLAHQNDHNRSIPLACFATVLSVSGMDFVSLQKEVSEEQAIILREHGVAQLGQEFQDFAAAAAVIAMLDLVISVDTSVAHLAGSDGQGRRPPGTVFAGFQVDARSHRQSLVSNHAVVPPARDRRLGRSARAAE